MVFLPIISFADERFRTPLAPRLGPFLSDVKVLTSN